MGCRELVELQCLAEQTFREIGCFPINSISDVWVEVRYALGAGTPQIMRMLNRMVKAEE